MLTRRLHGFLETDHDDDDGDDGDGDTDDGDDDDGDDGDGDTDDDDDDDDDVDDADDVEADAGADDDALMMTMWWGFKRANEATCAKLYSHNHICAALWPRTGMDGLWAEQQPAGPCHYLQSQV